MVRRPILARLVAAGGNVEIKPIIQVPIVATVPGGRLVVVVVARNAVGREEGGEATQQEVKYNLTNAAALLSLVVSLQQQLEDIAESLFSSTTVGHDLVMRRLESLERSVQRIALQPVA